MTPIAANAISMTPLDYVRIASHHAEFGPLPEVQRIDAVQGMVPGQTVVQSGQANQLYPNSVGG